MVSTYDSDGTLEQKSLERRFY